MNKPVQARSLAMIERVLDAAEELVARQGIGSLTMDAVAAVAGVSKGAVVHHFRSKDALVEALVSRKLDGLRDELGTDRSLATADRPAGTLLAMARHAATHYTDEQSFSRALLVAAVETPRALNLFKAHFVETIDQVRMEAAGREQDIVLLFALLGLLLTKSLGIASLSSGQATSVVQVIIDQVQHRSSESDQAEPSVGLQSDGSGAR